MQQKRSAIKGWAFLLPPTSEKEIRLCFIAFKGWSGYTIVKKNI
jgi:hypothetical protein